LLTALIKVERLEESFCELAPAPCRLKGSFSNPKKVACERSCESESIKGVAVQHQRFTAYKSPPLTCSWASSTIIRCQAIELKNEGGSLKGLTKMMSVSRIQHFLRNASSTPSPLVWYRLTFSEGENRFISSSLCSHFRTVFFFY